jgi:hypothetical protein
VEALLEAAEHGEAARLVGHVDPAVLLERAVHLDAVLRRRVVLFLSAIYFPMFVPSLSWQNDGDAFLA